MVICDTVSVVVVHRGVVMEGGDENFSRALQEMHVDNSESHIRQVDDKPAGLPGIQGPPKECFPGLVNFGRGLPYGVLNILGLPLSTSAKFLDFWTPSPLVRTSVRLFVRKIG